MMGVTCLQTVLAETLQTVHGGPDTAAGRAVRPRRNRSALARSESDTAAFIQWTARQGKLAPGDTVGQAVRSYAVVLHMATRHMNRRYDRRSPLAHSALEMPMALWTHHSAILCHL
jgi:hypothetical protein